MVDLPTTKTLFGVRSGNRSLHWYGVLVRILLLTFIGTLMSFTTSLLLAIVGTVVVSAIRGVRPDMTIAYWHIALPIALVAGGMILLFATVFEVRHYQQRKALRAIERMG